MSEAPLPSQEPSTAPQETFSVVAPEFPVDPEPGVLYITPPMFGRDTERWVGLSHEEQVHQLDRHIGLVRDMGKMASHIKTQELDEAKRQNAELLEMTLKDKLTGLDNRRSFEIDLLTVTEQENKDRYRDPRTGLLFIDLDKFKKVNDVHGHDVGDEVLVRVGTRLNERLTQETGGLRKADKLYRLGGDEFVVIADTSDKDNTLRKPHTSEEALQGLSGRIETIVAEIAAEMGIDFGASVGYVAYRKGETPEQYLKRADQEMYARKLQKKRAEQGRVARLLRRNPSTKR